MHKRIIKVIPILLLTGIIFTACSKSGEIKINKTESGYFTESTEQSVSDEIADAPILEEELTVSEDFADMAINGTFSKSKLTKMSSEELATLYVKAVTLPLCETDEEKRNALKAFVEMYSQEAADGMSLEELFNKAVELIKAQIEGSNLGRQECIDVLVMQSETPEKESLSVNEVPASTEEVSEEEINEILATAEATENTSEISTEASK